MLRKKKPESIFYYSIYRKFKNKQNEPMVIEFRRVTTSGEAFVEEGGGILVNV